MFNFVLAIVEAIGFPKALSRSISFLSAFFMYLRATFGFYILNPINEKQLSLLLIVTAKVVHSK